MENQPIQTPIQAEIHNQPLKRFPVLSIVLIFIALLLLFSTVFLAYQNMQLQKQLVSLQSTSPPEYIEEGKENLTHVDQYIDYVIPEGWKKEISVDGELLLTSPDHIQEFGTAKGMKISIYTDDWRYGAIDPNIQFDSFLNGGIESGISDPKRVDLFSVPAIRYRADWEGLTSLRYYVLFSGYGWHVVFDTASLAEEKKYQKVIDQFLENLKFEKKNNALPVETNVNINWRTYQGETFSFQYPNNWPDAVIGKLATTQNIDFDGGLGIEYGTYLNQELQRPMTYDEYLKKVVPKDTQEMRSFEYSIDGVQGVRWVEKDDNGEIIIKIIIPDKSNGSTFYTISYYSHIAGVNDAATIAGEVLDPVLATFKFK